MEVGEMRIMTNTIIIHIWSIKAKYLLQLFKKNKKLKSMLKY
jgi:hypothetical protein